VRLVDTAGLGQTSDRIDAMGQGVTRKYSEAADLVLVCAAEAAGGAGKAGGAGRVLLVHTKADLFPDSDSSLRVSSKTGEGLDQLRRAVAERLFAGGVALADMEPMITRERHRVALARAAEALAEARPQIAAGGDAVLGSHHVQEAVRALDSLIGVVDVEDVLDRVFSSFCVGK
jgi:tRNA modification GTPase